jgi:CelD/BcsL family acetyltransferase involved in cellulose biosynthesis
MSIELIQTEPKFQDLKEDWNSLLADSASHVPFLRHEFLDSWWQTLGGGEWTAGDLAVLLHRDGAGKLDGIAPFFRHADRILFLGSHEISDYLDFIAPPDKLADIISEFLDFIQGPSFPDWRVLDLYNLLDSSPSLPILRNITRDKDLKMQEQIIQPAPYIQLPASWEAYLEDLTPRYRRDLEKKLASADQYFLPISWYIADDPLLLERELDDFLELMANHPEKDLFLTPEMVRQIKNTSRAAFEAGWLQLAFLQVGDIKAAGYLNFDFNGQIWVYNSGFNPLFENITPGWVLLGKLIRWAIDEGRNKLDFMRGDETYKYQFGGIDKQVLRLQIKR